jgi:hypothetical protein
LLSHYLRWIRCWGIQFDFVRDLGPELPSAIGEFTMDMSGDQFNGDVVVGSWDNLEMEAQWLMRGKWTKMDATDDIGILGAWTNEVVERRLDVPQIPMRQV